MATPEAMAGLRLWVWIAASHDAFRERIALSRATERHPRGAAERLRTHMIDRHTVAEGRVLDEPPQVPDVAELEEFVRRDARRHIEELELLAGTFDSDWEPYATRPNHPPWTVWDQWVGRRHRAVVQTQDEPASLAFVHRVTPPIRPVIRFEDGPRVLRVHDELRDAMRLYRRSADAVLRAKRDGAQILERERLQLCVDVARVTRAARDDARCDHALNLEDVGRSLDRALESRLLRRALDGARAKSKDDPAGYARRYGRRGPVVASAELLEAIQGDAAKQVGRREAEVLTADAAEKLGRGERGRDERDA